VLFTHGFVVAAFPGWIAVVTGAGSVADGAMIAVLALAVLVLAWVDGYEDV
jgi:hypothetical protein